MQHEYEPGDVTHPMHTDPSCRVCGAPKADHRRLTGAFFDGPVTDLDGKRLDRGARWAEHELRAMKVADLRKVAVDARYRWELTTVVSNTTGEQTPPPA